MTEECSWWNEKGNDCSICLGLNKWINHLEELEELERFNFAPPKDTASKLPIPRC